MTSVSFRIKQILSPKLDELHFQSGLFVLSEDKSDGLNLVIFGLSIDLSITTSRSTIPPDAVLHSLSILVKGK